MKTMPLSFTPPKELLKVWIDEAAEIPAFVPTLKPLALAVNRACLEIGRQHRIAGAQK